MGAREEEKGKGGWEDLCRDHSEDLWMVGP